MKPENLFCIGDKIRVLDDLNVLAVVQKCIETGNPVYGKVDKKGRLTLKVDK